MDSIPTTEHREQLAEALRQAIATGGDYEVVRRAANYLLAVDEQLNPSKDEPMTWKGETK